MTKSLDEEVEKLTIEYVLRYMNLELEIKKVKQDMLTLKEEYDEQGLSTSQVLKAYRMYKSDNKLGDKRDILEAYKKVLDGCSEVEDKLLELNSKDDH